MRGVVTLEIGQCGNAIGTDFWEIVAQEHGIDGSGCYVGRNETQLQRVQVYFNEIKQMTYTPRTFMIDLERTSIEKVRFSSYGGMFNPENFIFGESGAANNFAKGHFTEGAEICYLSLDKIRREVEACDCFHGFQIIHSLGGGTGSGLGSLLISKLREEYLDRMIVTYSLVPSPKFLSSVVESYNAILAISHMTEFTNETYCLDNEALHNIVTNILKKHTANYCDLNYLISMVMSGITTCIRFPGPSNADLRKVAVNMVPFEKLHYFIPGFSPITTRGSLSSRKLTAAELTNQLFDFKHLFATCDAKKGKLLTASCIYRGEISCKEIDKQLGIIKSKQSNNFVEWIPDNIKTALSDIPPSGLRTAATFLGNTTAVQDIFQRVLGQFSSMLKKKAFLHWFLSEGMEELEFEAAEANVNDLISEYKQHAKVTSETPKPDELISDVIK